MYKRQGHSFLPCDRCFGVTEKFIKKKDYVFSLNQYVHYVFQAFGNCTAILVQQNMILNFTQQYEGHLKKVIVNECKKRFKISQYRIFEYSMDHVDTIRVSVSTSLRIYYSFSIQSGNSRLSHSLLSTPLHYQ